MKDKRLYHTVAEQIIRLIKSGDYPPGSRLPGERELAEKFKVSRVTIREAEIALQALSRIRIKTGSGVYVLEESERDSNSLPDVTAFELTEARLLFESEAAALAARVISDETIAQLEACVEAMESDDPARAAAAEKADHLFHMTIAGASGNAAVSHIVGVLWKMRTEVEQVRDVHESVCATDGDIRGVEHSDILNALRAHDPNAARRAMQAHFRRLLESMLDVTEEQALEKVKKQLTESRARYLQKA